MEAREHEENKRQECLGSGITPGSEFFANHFGGATGSASMGKITVLEAYANVLQIAQSMASGLEKRASVAIEIDRFTAGGPTAAARARLREKLRLATRRSGMPEETRDVIAHILVYLARDGV